MDFYRMYFQRFGLAIVRTFLVAALLVIISAPSFAADIAKKQQIPKVDIEKLRADAEQGHDSAMAALAERYADGVDVPQDFVKAYMWYSLYPRAYFLDQFDALAEKMTPEQVAEGKRLAEQMQQKIDAGKNKATKGGMGVLCMWDLLVEVRSAVDRCSSGSPHPHQNLEEAYFWLTIAKDTSGMRNRVDQKLTQEQRLAIRKRIADWKPTVVSAKPLDDSQKKAIERFGADENHIKEQMLAENGNAIDEFGLGADYQYGLHRAQDFKEAEKWYRKSAEQGEPHAQQNLGLMYSSLSDGGLDNKHLIEVLDKQLGRINEYIIANSPTPTTKAELEEKIKSYNMPAPFGCSSENEGRGIIDAFLPPEKLGKIVGDLLSVPGKPQMEPCF